MLTRSCCTCFPASFLSHSSYLVLLKSCTRHMYLWFTCTEVFTLQFFLTCLKKSLSFHHDYLSRAEDTSWKCVNLSLLEWQIPHSLLQNSLHRCDWSRMCHSDHECLCSGLTVNSIKKNCKSVWVHSYNLRFDIVIQTLREKDVSNTK